MARPKLLKEQRLQLKEWIAADYDTELIELWFIERNWPIITRQDISYYRKRYAEQINILREQRLSLALTTGLALKEERVARLKAEADALEAIKWEANKDGRLWNEKSWRETLEQIADETEDRKGKPVFPSEITVTFKRSDEQKAGD
jgi:hypothetical protein